MNKQGKAYVESVNKRYSSLRKLAAKEKRTLPDWNWTHSKFQERLLRIGAEAREFEIEADGIADLEAIVISSLKEDLLNKEDQNHDQQT